MEIPSTIKLRYFSEPPSSTSLTFAVMYRYPVVLDTATSSMAEILKVRWPLEVTVDSWFKFVYRTVLPVRVEASWTGFDGRGLVSFIGEIIAGSQVNASRFFKNLNILIGAKVAGYMGK